MDSRVRSVLLSHMLSCHGFDNSNMQSFGIRKGMRKMFKKTNRATVLMALGLIVALAISGTALAFVYYSMQVNMTWKVQTNYALQVWNQNKTQQISFIDWGQIPRNGLATANFYVKNTGNIAAKVQLNITGNYYGYWNVTDTFIDYQTIPKDGFSSLFNVTIQDYDADASATYTGILTFNVVS